MKKFIVLLSAGLLIFAFAATGFAQDKLDFRVSGMVEAQTHYSVNVPPLNPGATPIFNPLSSGSRDYISFTGGTNPDRALNRKVSYWDSRMHLKMDMVMGKELSGTLMLEIDAGRWGAGQNSGGASNQFREAGLVGYWSTDRTALEVKYVYFDVALPYLGIPVPMTLRLGAQPLAIRPGFFVATDGAGLSGGIKIDPVMINPVYFKPFEGADWTADDIDVYGLQVSAKIGQITVGGYGLWYNMGTLPVAGTATSQGFSIPSSLYPVNQGTMEGDFGWLGFYSDGKLGPVNYNFDIAYDYGKARSRLSPNAHSVKYNGWATRVKIDYPWEKANFGITAMYASGSDGNKTSSVGLPGTAIANNPNIQSSQVNGWMVPVGSEVGAANGESAVFYGMEAGASGGQGFAVNHNYNQPSKGAFGGTWFTKLYASYKVTPIYKVILQGLYIGDTMKHGNTYGTAVRADGRLRNDSTIGYEIDLINDIQIYKNLNFKIFGGYMFAGKALDFRATGVTNFDMHNPWAIRTRLMYTF